MKSAIFRPWLFSRVACVSFLLVLLEGTSAGSQISWNVIGTFTDGGSLTGWVEFDTSATSDVASNFSLTVSGGNVSVFPAFTYTPNNSFSGGGFSLAELLVNQFANGRELFADFSSSLTVA